MEKTLIVVYKDEMLVNQLKKLVETNDDKQDGDTVGTMDNSINIVAWNEKVWLGNKKAGNIKDKVLFLGDIKGTDKLIPVLDLKFDQYGVKYGWAGNQAVLYTDYKNVSGKEAYLTFIEELAKLPVPEMIKQPKNARVTEEEKTTEVVRTEDGKAKLKMPAFLLKAKDTVEKGADALGKAGVKAASATEDIFRDRNAVTRQQLFYGVVNLYHHGLQEFMDV